VKYSAGPVTCDVAAEDGWVRLTVSDAGRGIDPSDLATIFDEFERGRMAENDGGQGLGLTSVRSLVESLGGRVNIESAVGQGTTVVVELPQEPGGA
jgi:signal transduction histidine kinase